MPLIYYQLCIFLSTGKSIRVRRNLSLFHHSCLWPWETQTFPSPPVANTQWCWATSGKGRWKKPNWLFEKAKEVKLPEIMLSSVDGSHMWHSSGRIGTTFHPWDKSKVTNILKHCLKIITQQVKKKWQVHEMLVNKGQRKYSHALNWSWATIWIQNTSKQTLI